MAGSYRVVDHVVDTLDSLGVEHVFGVDGANIEDLYDALHANTRVTGVLAKHEFSAATMADGYSRSGAGLGVVAATSGGGCLNLIAGLGESLTSRVPVLALVGQPPTMLDGKGSFQDTSGLAGSLDALALFSAVSVYCRRVTSATELPSMLTEAIAAARHGGPAVLLLPKDVQQAECARRGLVAVSERRGVGDVRRLIDELRHSTGSIAIIAGPQVARDDARAELDALAALLGAAVATEPDAKDVASTPLVTGVMGHPGVAAAIADSGVCLLVGARLAVTARAGLEDALASVETLSIGSEPPFVTSSHVASDDLHVSLAAMVRALEGQARPPKPLSLNELRPPTYEGSGVRYRAAMSVLDASLPADADIVVDAGNSGAAAVHWLPVRRDGRFVVALGMGGMGYSFGAAIGMAFGRGRRCVVIAGDGSFFMHGMEIHTAIEYRLPITFVLLNNNAHAMCVTREQLYYGGGYSYNRFQPARLGAGLAAMFPGLAAVDVAAADALPDALSGALSHQGPSVVSIECSADEIAPFAPFLTTLTQPTTTISKEHHRVAASA